MTEIVWKPDKHGRNSKRSASKHVREALALPKNRGWNIPLPRDLLGSPAMLVLPHYSRQALDAIMLEFCEQGGGPANGELIVTYDDMQRRGMRRGSIRPALVILESVGLIATRRDTRSGALKEPTRYRLTWLGTAEGMSGTYPTNEWAAIKTIEEAKARVRNALDALERERTARKARTLARTSAIRAAA